MGKFLFISQIKTIFGDFIATAIQLVGFDKFDGFTVNKARGAAQALIDKYSKMFGEKSLLEFRIVVDKVRERGKHVDYEIKAHLDTTKGHFYASKAGWKILDVVDEVLNEIDRQITEKKEKLKEHRELPDNA